MDFPIFLGPFRKKLIGFSGIFQRFSEILQDFLKIFRQVLVRLQCLKITTGFFKVNSPIGFHFVRRVGVWPISFFSPSTSKSRFSFFFLDWFASEFQLYFSSVCKELGFKIIFFFFEKEEPKTVFKVGSILLYEDGFYRHRQCL